MMARGIIVDSGAADNVMPRRLVRGENNKVRPSAASRAGVNYVAASNTRIPDEGETDLKFKSGEGHDQDWTFQAAEVNKVLAAVSALVDDNNCVILDKDMVIGEDISFTTNKATGNSIRMRRERSVLLFDAFIDEEDDCDTSDSDLGFARNAAPA